jgi:hypothetical protein
MGNATTSKSDTVKNENQAGSTFQAQAPWSVQAPFVQDAFTKAQGALGAASGAASPTDFVAGFSPDQLNLFKQMMGEAGSSTPGTTAAAGANMLGMGTSAMADAFGKMTGWTPSGGVDSNIAAAGKYADNPYVDGMVDASMRGAQREARESIMPGIERGAAGTGNLNSSRRFLREGVVDRALAEKRADIDSNIRGNLYSGGLDRAEGGRVADNNAMLEAMRSQLMGGAGAAGAGVGALDSSVSQKGGLYDIAGKGAMGAYGADQAKLDNEMAKFQFGSSSPFEALKQYYGIVGDKSWGGTSAGTFNTKSNSVEQKTATPSMLDTIGKLMGSFGSFIPK